MESTIAYLKTALNDAKSQVVFLEKALENTQREFQKSCTHDFIAEDDGDYHSPGYYFTCERCNYFTRIRPDKFRYK